MQKSDIDIELLFGKDRGQEDENLSKYFIKTGQYRSIFNGNKELVLGRKGSGKSSIFSHLCLELPNNGTIPVPISPTGEDFSLIENKLSSYKDMDFHDDFKYSLAWYELILTEIAFSVISEKHGSLIKGTDEVLYKYVKSNEKVKGDFVSRFANAVLKAFSGGKVNLGAAELNIDFSSFSEMDAPDNNKIKKALYNVIIKNEFFVMVDNLDEPWKNTLQMNCWLRGLILAARRLKRDFKNLKIVIFLRDDIYNEIVKGSDIFDSRSELLFLNWKDKNFFSLRQLLAARIANYYRETYPKSVDEFDELLKRIYPLELVLHNKHRYTTQYIGHRTFYKPRDFLQFFRSSIEVSYSEVLPIPQGAIIKAEAEYSSWKISFVEGEYSKTYERIKECVNTFVGATNDWTMPYKDVLTHLTSIDDSAKIFNKAESYVLTPEQAADFLFSCGFFRKVKRGYQSTTFLTYLDEPNPRIKGSNLDIHPAFRTSLAKR